MATLLFLVDKKLKNLSSQIKTLNTQHNILRHLTYYINKATVKIFKFARFLILLKDNFGESVGAAELKMIL